MFQIILMIHVVIAVALIALVLMQQGAGATAGTAFGAGASGTVFGSKGSGSFMLKITAFFGLLFFVASLTLTYLAGGQLHHKHKHSVLENVVTLSRQAKQAKESASVRQAKQAILRLKDAKAASDVKKTAQK
jgi:preprotein translocase subunit SecG